MHASLAELLENLKPGLLWVAAVGVRDSERGATSDLRCRVIPGLASDDASVLIGHDVTHDARAGYDNLVQVFQIAREQKVSTHIAADRLAERRIAAGKTPAATTKK